MPRQYHRFLISLWFTQTLTNPDHYLHSDGILILLNVDDVSISYRQATVKAVIDDKPKLSEKYKITNLGAAHQFLSIEIRRDCTGVSLRQKACIT
jgi:hypothetical protein